MNENAVIVVIAALLIISAVQAVELSSVSQATPSVGDMPEATYSPGQQSVKSGVPSNLQEIPDMVGGC